VVQHPAGTSPLQYQWLRNGTNINGATAPTCLITNAQLADAGQYAVTVSNSFGSVTSASAVLTVIPDVGSSTNRVLSLNTNSDYVTIPSASDLQNPDEITIEAWVYPVGGSGGGPVSGWGRFVNKGDSGSGNSSRSYELTWLPGSYSNLVFTIFWGTNTWGVVSAAAPTGMWVHVAVTYSSFDSALRMYTNGVLASSTTNDAGGNPINGQKLRQTTYPLVLGADLFHNFGYIAGSMDEVRIWSKARTAEEIYANRFCRLTGTETNLAGYWTFDDGTANDLTGHSHNGTFSGNAQAVPVQGTDAVHAGVCGSQLVTNRVLSLDGNGDYVTIASAADLQNPTEITFEAWVYPTNKGYFMIKGDAGFVNSARTYELSWSPGTGNNLDFSIFLGASTWASVGASAPTGRWVHVACTYSSTDSVLRIFTNGVLVWETTRDAGGVTPLNHQTLRQTTLPLVFGAELTHPLGFVAGRMDEIRIWNKARTPEEIYANQFCRLTGTESNLVAYWTFDDGTANDQTGHGHNGIFSGNAQAQVITGTFTNRPALHIEPAANMGVNVTLKGEFGGSYRIQSSSNLTNWTDWQSVMHSFGQSQYFHGLRPDSARFFRVVTP
jgi:hypothetical protein